MPKIDPAEAPRGAGNHYPSPYDEPCRGRTWLKLGDAAGLSQFGVNLVTIPPGGWSSQRHWHTHEDEFVWMVEGELALVTDAGETVLRAGDCAGFKAGAADGHHLVNRGTAPARFLAVGSRIEADQVVYPDIDMRLTPAGEFTREDGTRY